MAKRTFKVVINFNKSWLTVDWNGKRVFFTDNLNIEKDAFFWLKN